ncbi:MAG: Gmad2 immunoglobulin-like domain-containing protein [Patescibacteria group bacterium]
MKHPFSIALVAILALLGVALVGLLVFRLMNGAIIPPDWRDTDDTTDVGDGTNVPGDTDDTAQAATSTSGNITVTSPTADETIGLPLVTKGKARVFEGTFNYRLLDANETVLAEGNAMSNAPDVGEFGAFTVTTSYDAPTGTSGTLEVFDYSAKDGAVIDLVTFPVKFPTMETMIVKTYWTNMETSGSCSSVTATERRVAKSAAVGYTALTELLAGPNTPESMAQLATSIPPFVSIKSLTINDGVAKVEFSKSLESGGSCRVASIRAQIESTLKQFPTVTSVIISTEGRTSAESLQP